MTLQTKRIRFIPRNLAGPDDPVNRMRCFNVIRGLQQKGYNLALYKKGEKPDLLVTASLDFGLWGELYATCFNSAIPVILDLAENEFERSAVVTGRKLRNIVSRSQGSPNLYGKLRGFVKRRRFDRSFYSFVNKCSGLVACSRVIVKDSEPFVERSFFVPDAIDFQIYGDGKEYAASETKTICWVGMPPGLHFLLPINEVLYRLQEKYKVDIAIITSSDYRRLSRKAVERFRFRHTFVRWSLDTVGLHLASSDVGIAPLPHDSYKSSNKIASYWAVGLPVVASPTAEYSHVVSHGHNGFLAETPSEWDSCLSSLLLEIDLQRQFGRAGRQYAMEHFSIERVSAMWEQVLADVVEQGKNQS